MSEFQFLRLKGTGGSTGGFKHNIIRTAERSSTYGFANPISIITGGPGTGKTTVLKIILYIYQKKCGNEVKLMAPTGRAARRMAESTGSGDATTMHMALGLLVMVIMKHL